MRRHSSPQVFGGVRRLREQLPSLPCGLLNQNSDPFYVKLLMKKDTNLPEIKTHFSLQTGNQQSNLTRREPILKIHMKLCHRETDYFFKTRPVSERKKDRPGSTATAYICISEFRIRISAGLLAIITEIFLRRFSW